jgi:hypothetical protein
MADESESEAGEAFGAGTALVSAQIPTRQAAITL